MKPGDMVKWRNSKSFSGGCADIMDLDETWFNYAVVIDVKPPEDEINESCVTILFEGNVLDVPGTILSLAEDPRHIATVLEKQTVLQEAIKRRKGESG